MRITKMIVDSDEGMNTLTIFSDGHKGFGSEKRLVITNPNGEVEVDLYKATSDEPHAKMILDDSGETIPEVGFSQDEAASWQNVMGHHPEID